MSTFVDRQTLFTADKVDHLQHVWVFSVIDHMSTFILPSFTGSKQDTLAFRFKSNQLTSSDLELLPVFKRMSMAMRTDLTDVIHQNVNSLLRMLQQHCQLQAGSSALAGYPSSLQTKHLPHICDLDAKQTWAYIRGVDGASVARASGWGDNVLEDTVNPLLLVDVVVLDGVLQAKPSLPDAKKLLLGCLDAVCVADVIDPYGALTGSNTVLQLPQQSDAVIMECRDEFAAAIDAMLTPLEHLCSSLQHHFGSFLAQHCVAFTDMWRQHSIADVAAAVSRLGEV